MSTITPATTATGEELRSLLPRMACGQKFTVRGRTHAFFDGSGFTIQGSKRNAGDAWRFKCFDHRNGGFKWVTVDNADIVTFHEPPTYR